MDCPVPAGSARRVERVRSAAGPRVSVRGRSHGRPRRQAAAPDPRGSPLGVLPVADRRIGAGRRRAPGRPGRGDLPLRSRRLVRLPRRSSSGSPATAPGDDTPPSTASAQPTVNSGPARYHSSYERRCPHWGRPPRLRGRGGSLADGPRGLCLLWRSRVRGSTSRFCRLPLNGTPPASLPSGPTDTWLVLTAPTRLRPALAVSSATHVCRGGNLRPTAPDAYGVCFARFTRRRRLPPAHHKPAGAPRAAPCAVRGPAPCRPAFKTTAQAL